jgi:hypothetical protein
MNRVLLLVCVAHPFNSVLQCLKLSFGDCGVYHLQTVYNPLLSGVGNLRVARDSRCLISRPDPFLTRGCTDIRSVSLLSTLLTCRPVATKPRDLTLTTAIKTTRGSVSTDSPCTALLTACVCMHCSVLYIYIYIYIYVCVCVCVCAHAYTFLVYIFLRITRFLDFLHRPYF